MATALNKADMLANLKSQAAALGLRVNDEDGDGLSAKMESIGAKWFLGGRKVSYKASCRLADVEHIVHFRDMVTERSWGIPPPTLSVETTTTKGWERSGSRTDRSVGGGGRIDYARVRDKVKEAVSAAGWQFHLEGGRVP